MKNIIFVGTLHAGLTPHRELAEVLEQFKPEHLLVEISQSDLENNHTEKYPPEMRFAVEWAAKNRIPVFGFDASINTFAKGKTDSDNQVVIEEQSDILKRYSWKDANRADVNDELDTPQAMALVDSAKEKEREQKMLQNINKLLSPDKISVILTGAGHLAFFEQNYPEAIFPFRRKR